MAGLMENLARIGEKKEKKIRVSRPELGSQLNFSRRIPELDGFRGTAVAVCLFFHYFWIPTMAPPRIVFTFFTEQQRSFGRGWKCFLFCRDF